MYRNIVFAGMIALGLLCLSATVRADALDDARKMIADKKYSEVDKVLERELGESRPRPEALRISYEAAMAGGRFVTAERRMSALLKLTQNKDLDLLYQGGVCAERIGDVQGALTRYVLYAQNCDIKKDNPEKDVKAEKDGKTENADKTLKEDKAKKEKLEHALNFILMHGAYPSEYKKYVQVFGANENAWNFGSILLDRLCALPDSVRALEIAAFMQENFPAPAKVNTVHRRLRVSSENYELGKDPKDRFVKPLLVMAAGVPSDYDSISWVFQNANATMSPPERFDMALKIQSATKKPLLAWLAGSFSNLREFKDPEVQKAAAKKFLELESIYRASTNRNDYLLFMQVLSQCPAAFSISDKNKEPLVSASDAKQKFDVLRKKYADAPMSLGGIFQELQSRFMSGDARADFLRKNIDILSPGQVNDLVALDKGQNISATLAEYGKGRNYKDMVDVCSLMMTYYKQSKDTNASQLLFAAAKDYMFAYPGSFNWRHIRDNFINSPVISSDKKLELLRDQITFAGYSPIRSELLKDMAKDKVWADSQAFQDLVKLHNAKGSGSDILGRCHIAVCSTNDAKEVLSLGDNFLKEYKGQIPGGFEKTADRESLLAANIFAREIEVMWNDSNNISALAEAWAPRLGLGSSWDSLTRRLLEHNKRGMLVKVACSYVALTKRDPGSQSTWDYLSNGISDNNDFRNPLEGSYAKMGTDRAARFVLGNWDSWKGKSQFLMDQVEKAVVGTGCKFSSLDAATPLIRHMFHNANAQNKVPPTLTQALWNFLISKENESGSYDTDLEGLCYGQQIRSANDSI